MILRAALILILMSGSCLGFETTLSVQSGISDPSGDTTAPFEYDDTGEIAVVQFDLDQVPAFAHVEQVGIATFLESGNAFTDVTVLSTSELVYIIPGTSPSSSVSDSPELLDGVQLDVRGISEFALVYSVNSFAQGSGAVRDTTRIQVTWHPPGDTDADDDVDFVDFVNLSNNFGQLGGVAEGDFTGDGMVDFADFVILSNNFGAW